MQCNHVCNARQGNLPSTPLKMKQRPDPFQVAHCLLPRIQPCANRSARPTAGVLSLTCNKWKGRAHRCLAAGTFWVIRVSKCWALDGMVRTSRS